MSNIVDFKYVQEHQRKFLEHLKNIEGINYQEGIYNVPMWLVLALQSELSEILNETKIHKWWDKQKPNEEHLLEECSDFLAHLGNLANFLEVEMIMSIDEIQTEELEKQFNYLAYKITTLPWKKMFARNKLINCILPAFVQLVYSLGFTLEELKQAYLKKMNTNYSRFS